MFLVNCAGAGFVPTGGPQDLTPAQLLETSIEKGSVNFEDNKIVFEFDEFIKLNNPSKNFFFSPNTSDHFSLSVKGKKLIVSCEDLLPNTTYNLSFLKIIKDYTEGNESEPFTFHFSTGSYLDSLQLAVDFDKRGPGISENPINALLYLPTDTPFVSKPYYRTTVNNKDLSFSFLPDRPFKLALIADNNNNLIPDKTDEFFYVSDSLVRPNKIGDNLTDSAILHPLQAIPTLNAERYLTSVLVTSNSYGFPLKAIGFSDESQILNDSKDSLWVKNVPDSLSSILIYNDTQKDTIEIRNPPRKNPFIKDTLLFNTTTFSILAETYIAASSIAEDSIKLIDSASRNIPFSLILDTSLTPYTFSIQPMVDTLRFPLTLKVKEKAFELEDSTFSKPFNRDVLYPQSIEKTSTIKVMDNEQQTSLLRILLINNTTNHVTYDASIFTEPPNISEGSYSLFIYIDKNNNQRYDGASWPDFKPAEEIIYQQKKFSVRPNWEHVINLESL